MSQPLSLKEKYEQEVKPVLIKEFQIKNPLAVPKIEKITVNAGVGSIFRDKGALQKISDDLAKITGQRPAVSPARISVAGFSVRAGMPVGLKTTLRGVRMYNFLHKLIAIALPRFRDFRGLSLKSFDRQGNYTLGVPEHTVFPEIDLAKVDRPQGLEITIVIKSAGVKQSRRLLELLGLPFEKEDNKD